MKTNKSINRYIPEKVSDYIKQSDYKNKEHLIIICDMIYRVNNYKKQDIDYSNQFTDIPQNYFKDIITNPRYIKSAKDFLIDKGIIECDNIYSKIGGKALGYRFNNDYLSKLVKVVVKKPTITKKIIKNVNEKNNAVNDKYKKYKEYFLNNFSIDYKKAIKYLDNNLFKSLEYISPSYTSSLCGVNLEQKIKIINKYNHHFMAVSAINDGELFFRHNKTNGRIDTNLTNLKSELKQFISPKGLVQLDIVNSQPYFLSLLIPSLCGVNLEQDIIKFIDVTRKGKFYEFFQQQYNLQTGQFIDRKGIKDIMFCIFYSKNTSYKKEKRIFKMLFPNVLKIIENQKKNKHNQLAIQMQITESKMCIDTICQELDRNNIEYFTIHDAWLVDDKNINETKKIIQDCFDKEYKSIPKIDITNVNKK